MYGKNGETRTFKQTVKNPVAAALKSLFGNEFGSVTVNEALSSETKSN